MVQIGCIAEGVGCIMCFHRPKALGPRAEVRPIEEDRVQHILKIFSLLKLHGLRMTSPMRQNSPPTAAEAQTSQ
ncbi:unnamed protein product [Lathyrus oleraceus]